MSWKRTDEQAERHRFIEDWLKVEYSFSALCDYYGISRKTGYKLINRFKEEGLQATEARSHTRHTHPNRLSDNMQQLILELKHRFPKWGPSKLRDWLVINRTEFHPPAASTISELLKRHGLVKPRRYRRHVPAYSDPFLDCDASNAVWSADYKGQFKVGNKYCYPLTISDNYSRFLLLCEGLEGPRLESTMKGFEKAFIEYGMPDAIRTDNGTPFASCGVGGLSRLSIWWLKLGILPERIDAGCPEQNGRHERMHRTLKEATAKPAETNFKAQQESFDKFRNEYNQERPHEALNGKRPADVYTASAKQYTGKLEEFDYARNKEIRRVRRNGDIKCFNRQFYLSTLLTGESVGLEIIDDGKAMVYLGRLRLGLVDARAGKVVRI